MALAKAAYERRDAQESEEKTLSPTIAVTWPNFVSRVECDAQFTKLEDQMKSLFRRLTHVEMQTANSQTQFDDLNSLCRQQCATKEMMAAAESRLSLDVALCQKEIEEGLESCHQRAADDVAAARVQAEQQCKELHEGLQTASDAIRGLGHVLQQSIEQSKAIFATQEALDTACKSLRKEQAVSGQELNALIESLDSSKCSRTEFHTAEAAHENKLAVLDGRVTEDSGLINRNMVELMQFRKVCEDSFMPKASLEDLQQGIMRLDEVAKAAEEERCTLHNDLLAEKERLSGCLVQQRDQGDHLRTAFRNIRDLDEHLTSLVTKLSTKCDGLSRELRQFESRHTDEIENCLRNSDEQKDAHQALRNAHEALQQDLTSHVETQKSISDGLRQYSTHHFIDQMDKALQLQKSVSKIEQGHVELSQSLQTIKLPKV